MSQILIGLSGGVDSFVAAWLLQQQGHRVTGAHLLLTGDEENDVLRETRRLCHVLSVPLHIVDARERFRREIILPFAESYRAGKTPNPCCRCNSLLKWQLLRETADALGIPRLATGHYIRTGTCENHCYFLRGMDPAKDQSYFLWGVPEAILRCSVTPLGAYTKTEVRKLAAGAGFQEMAQKKESMGICFLEGMDYRDYLLREAPALFAARPGEIVTRRGEVIGTHRGIFQYTIGQKRDIPSPDGIARYVLQIDAASNRIVVGEKNELFYTELETEQVHLINPEEIDAPDISVVIRGIGLNPQGVARLEAQPDGTLRIILPEPAWAPAPGQPVAFYRGDRLIGGGILR